MSRETCKRSPGEVRPEINRDRCEGKSDCVRVCPMNVFEVRDLTAAERRGMAFLARLKASAHGNRQAFAVGAALCEGCGLCLRACPERAITLVRYGSGAFTVAAR